MHNEFIDLGCGLDSKPVESTMASAPKKSYPCFSFSCDEEIELPDGKFRFMAEGRKVDCSENTRDEANPRYRYEIEVQGFKPMGAAKKDAPDMGGMFKKALNSGMAKKMGEYPEGEED